MKQKQMNFLVVIILKHATLVVWGSQKTKVRKKELATDNNVVTKSGKDNNAKDTDYRIVGGDVRLISEKYGWLEITKERLKNYFKIID